MMEIKRKIVIINDDPLVSKVYETYFKEAKFEVSFFNRVPENLIETILKEKPDVISIDLDLPGVSGIEIIKRLKTHPKTQEIPIIGLSHVSDKKIIEEAIKTGMDDYFIDYRIAPQDYVRAVRGFLENPDRYRRNYKRILGKKEVEEKEKKKTETREAVKSKFFKRISVKKKKKEVKKQRIFLSGPFQTEEQKNSLEEIRRELTKIGYNVFVGPRDIDNWGQTPVSHSVFWRAMIHEIGNSDILLVNLETIDFKMALEIGIGKAKNKKIILLSPSKSRVEDWLKGIVDEILVYKPEEGFQDIIKKDLKPLLEPET